MLLFSSKPSIFPYHRQKGVKVSHVSHSPQYTLSPHHMHTAYCISCYLAPSNLTGLSNAVPPTYIDPFLFHLLLLPRVSGVLLSSLLGSCPEDTAGECQPTSPLFSAPSFYLSQHFIILGQRQGILTFPIVCPACEQNAHWSWHMLFTKYIFAISGISEFLDSPLG